MRRWIFELPRSNRLPRYAYITIPPLLSGCTSHAAHIDRTGRNGYCNIIYTSQEWAYDQILSISFCPSDYDNVECYDSQEIGNMRIIYSHISQLFVVSGTAQSPLASYS